MQKNTPSSTLTRTLESGLSAIAAIFFLFSKENVNDLLLKNRELVKEGYIDSKTYFTRSKTDTRFPTGLSSEFPSGVNIMLPWRYTVPHILENYVYMSYQSNIAAQEQYSHTL